MCFTINVVQSNAKAKIRHFGRECLPPLRHWFRRECRYRADIPAYEAGSNSHGSEVTRTTKVNVVEGEERVDFVRDHMPWPQSSSHGMTEVSIHNCHEGLPSISEVVVVVDEILDAMRTQRIELRSMTQGQSLTTFHHILPVCSFHLHFTNKIANERA